MRFFQPHVFEQGHGDDIAVAKRVYREHLAGLSGLIPDSLLALEELEWKGDSLLFRVEHDRSERILELTLRCGWSGGYLDDPGYYDIRLTYSGAKISPEHDLTLAKIARSTLAAFWHPCDLCQAEFDVTDGGQIVHRFLFHASDADFPEAGGWLEFQIVAATVGWSRVQRPSRAFRRLPDRYPAGPPTEDFNKKMRER